MKCYSTKLTGTILFDFTNRCSPYTSDICSTPEMELIYRSLPWYDDLLYVELYAKWKSRKVQIECREGNVINTFEIRDHLN